jgi:transposase
MVAAALREDEMDASPAQNVFLRSESVHSWVRYKRLERGRFIWPQAKEGTVSLTRAQLSMLMEGIDWRRPERTWTPQIAV